MSDSEALKELSDIKETLSRLAPNKEQREKLCESLHKSIVEAGEEGIELRELLKNHGINYDLGVSLITDLYDEDLAYKYTSPTSGRRLLKSTPMKQDSSETEVNNRELSFVETSILLFLKVQFYENKEVTTSSVYRIFPISTTRVNAELRSLKERGLINVDKRGSASLWTLSDGFINESDD